MPSTELCRVPELLSYKVELETILLHHAIMVV